IIEDMKLDIPNIVDIFVMELVKTLHCTFFYHKEVAMGNTRGDNIEDDDANDNNIIINNCFYLNRF
ncbi:hypothetical protein Pmar_PMAR010672, partial [Perkinsus marinus ATCC 50983]